MLPGLPTQGDGLAQASLLRRIVAFAVDLTMALAIGAVALLCISLLAPLDSPEARLPRGLVFFLAAVYMLWGRDHGLPTPGRRALQLQLVLLPGPLPQALRRPLTVETGHDRETHGKQIGNAVILSGACTMLAAAALVASLHSTQVYAVARGYLASPAFVEQHGSGAALSPLAQSMLVAKHHAFLRANVEWPTDADGSATDDRPASLAFFLSRRSTDTPWQVTAVEPAQTLWQGKYGLSVADRDVPRAASATDAGPAQAPSPTHERPRVPD
ncbi:MAG: hypothetical protein KDK91_02545 [Gammaproteobacteria bacterium]|nr:hypothetical protein [Gammaproteobacteria bacterium]